jgi:hypothetical protein
MTEWTVETKKATAFHGRLVPTSIKDYLGEHPSFAINTASIVITLAKPSCIHSALKVHVQLVYDGASFRAVPNDTCQFQGRNRRCSVHTPKFVRHLCIALPQEAIKCLWDDEPRPNTPAIYSFSISHLYVLPKTCHEKCTMTTKLAFAMCCLR